MSPGLAALGSAGGGEAGCSEASSARLATRFRNFSAFFMMRSWSSGLRVLHLGHDLTMLPSTSLVALCPGSLQPSHSAWAFLALLSVLTLAPVSLATALTSPVFCSRRAFLASPVLVSLCGALRRLRPGSWLSVSYVSHTFSSIMYLSSSVGVGCSRARAPRPSASGTPAAGCCAARAAFAARLLSSTCQLWSARV